MEEKIEATDLLEIVRTLVKDEIIAKISKTQEGLHFKFLNGQTFTLVIWENKQKSLTNEA